MKRLLEAADSVTVTQVKSPVNLLKTTFNDPHVKAIMKHVTGGDSVKEQAVEAEVEERVEKLKCVAKVSPILYEAAIDNIIETVLFDKFWDRPDQPDGQSKAAAHPGYVPKAPPVTTAPKFDQVTFMKLVSKIKSESKSFFPLRNMIDFHVIKNPRISISGNGDTKLEKQLEAVSTAAATADGTFVFNKAFCQSLLDFAHLKGLKAGQGKHGKKYVSQGGDIPDEWEYIEFLIRHEFMHYTYSDFYYQKIIPESSGKLINWVGDFRSNHRLVHQGLNQLPLGLFSSYVNFHKQGSYRAMYDLVKSEFEKLGKECQEKLEKELERGTDEHGEGGNGTDGKPKPAPPRPPPPGAIDDWEKKIGKKIETDGKDDGEGEPSDEKPKDNKPGSSIGQRREIDYNSVSARYKWEALLKKMVATVSYTVDQSYQKISRRAIGTMQQVIKRGAGAIKPGDIKNPSKRKIKLAVIIDSSGSMGYIINTVMANLDKLLVQRSGVTGVQDEFYLFIFSGDYDIYECTPGTKGRAKHILDVDKKAPGPSGTVNLADVLSAHKAGGTVFGSDLTAQIKKLAGNGYNCLIVSDGDMLSGDNFTNFRDLYHSNRQKIWLLLDSQSTFASFVGKMKEVSDNASHL